MDALKKSGIYKNTIIVFSTDNGGVNPESSNFPLRGTKEQLYEGKKYCIKKIKLKIENWKNM